MKIPKNPLVKKLKGFGWLVKEIDGHDPQQIKKALHARRGTPCKAIFAKTTVNQLPFLKGQDAHYKVMNEEEYKLAMEVFK